MLKIKEDKMQELESLGFVENGYFSNFVYETTSKKVMVLSLQLMQKQEKLKEL